MEFLTPYDWTNEDERWQWLGTKRGEYHMQIVPCAGLNNLTPKEYLIQMLDGEELRGKAKKDAELLKDNPQLQWGFK